MSKPSLIEVVKSVAAAMVGVQSEKNRLKDFSQGSLKSYIVVGLIATVLFVMAVKMVVSIVIG